MRIARPSPQLFVAALVLVAACAEGPGSINAPVASPAMNAFASGLASSIPSRSVVGGPDLRDFHTFEGQIFICMDGNQTGVSFNFDEQVIRQRDGTVPPLPPTGEVGDYMWYDANGNGIQDSGEPGIAGVTVTLSGAASATATTDANGAYLFSGLGAGSYTVTVGTPAGYVPSASNAGANRGVDSNGSPAAVTLLTNDAVDLTIDFGYTNNVGPIGDYVWHVKVRDGIQEWGEYGIGGVVATLSGPANATTTTNSSGAYLFTGLPAGTYTVTVATPNGYVASPTLRGSNRAVDSNENGGTVVLATSSSVDLSIDFGFDKKTVVPCVQPTTWWIQNWWEWNSVADGRPLNKYQPFYSSGKDNWTMITMSNRYGNAYITLAQELITARLVKHWYETSGNSAVDAAMAGAEAYFASQPSGIQNPTGATKTQLLSWAETLDAWTDGRLGTKICGGNCRRGDGALRHGCS